MARKKTKSAEEGVLSKAKWGGFVNPRLTSQEKEAVKRKLLGYEDCMQFLLDAANDGYKVSIAYSIPEDVFTVSLTGVYNERPNPGLTMSMRHKEIEVAITALAWCQEQSGRNQGWTERFGGSDVTDW